MHLLFEFLRQLKENNTREWFQKHKPEYQKGEEEFKSLVTTVQEGLQEKDNIETGSTKIFRIYRDVRFAKDKRPFNIHRGASFKRSTVELRGGYYLRIEVDNSRIAGGFFAPNSQDLLHIRKQIQQDPDPLREMLLKDDYTQYFNGLEGDKVKTSPKGFEKSDPAIDLLRHKSFLVTHSFTNEEVLSEDFANKIVDGFHKMRPFFDYMSEILITDLNGIPLYES